MTVGSHRGISKMQTSLRRSRDSTVKATQNRTILLFRCSDAVWAAGSKILAAFFVFLCRFGITRRKKHPHFILCGDNSDFY